MSFVQSNFVVDTSNLQTELDQCKYDKISYDKSYNDMKQKIEQLQAQLGDLKGKSKDTPCVSDTLYPLSQKLEDENVSLEFQILNYAKENAYFKTIYKNHFDSIDVTRAQTKIITDSLQEKLNDTIYENAKLRAWLFDKVFEQNDTTKGTSENTKFANQSTLGKPSLQPLRNHLVVRQPNAFQSERLKFPKTWVPPKVVVKPSYFKLGLKSTAEIKRPQPRSNPKNHRIPSVSKISCLSNNIEKVEEHHKNLQFFKTLNHMSSEGNDIKLAIRNEKSKVVCATCKQCLINANHDECVFKYVNGMNSQKKNQNAKVSNTVNQKKHKVIVKKYKKLGSEERRASPRLRKPRTCLRWLPTGRIVYHCGKITAPSNIESESDTSVFDNTSASNPHEPTGKGFPNSTSFLGRFTRLRRHTTCIHPLDVL
ncbi:hypothetical protein Tco_0791305 [Tanacetum coccineum]